MNQQQLRKQLQQARAALTPNERETAAQRVGDHLLTLPELQHPIAIASYYSVGAELATTEINQRLREQDHQLALPVLHPIHPGHLLFLQVTEHTQWQPNKYAIPEPKLNCQHVVPLTNLQIALVPLVAFDSAGNRIGMGGGFYDRTLASCHRHQDSKLLRIGLAHDCQFLEHLPAQPWDVPLSMVITPSKIWDFRR